MQRKDIFDYVRSTYHTTIKKPWQKYPEYVVLRHQEQPGNNRWYGIIMNVSPKKLGIAGEKDVDIIDLKCDPELIAYLIDHKLFFPAYHMNKKHWLSVLINHDTPEAEVFSLIDKSHALTK